MSIATRPASALGSSSASGVKRARSRWTATPTLQQFRCWKAIQRTNHKKFTLSIFLASRETRTELNITQRVALLSPFSTLGGDGTARAIARNANMDAPRPTSQRVGKCLSRPHVAFTPILPARARGQHKAQLKPLLFELLLGSAAVMSTLPSASCVTTIRRVHCNVGTVFRSTAQSVIASWKPLPVRRCFADTVRIAARAIF
jgi:hypothetical protein